MNEFREEILEGARMRPKFNLELPIPVDAAIRRIGAGLDTQELRESAATAGRHAEFRVDQTKRKIWSPRLEVRVEDAPGGSSLHGRFAPRPDVWTGFMFVYFLAWFAVVFGATLGYVQQVSDERAWGFWAVPIGLLIIVGIHAASFVGRRLAEDQMRELRGKLDSVLSQQFGSEVTSEPNDLRRG
jgi:hypothetical protein